MNLGQARFIASNRLAITSLRCWDEPHEPFRPPIAPGTTNACARAETRRGHHEVHEVHQTLQIFEFNGLMTMNLIMVEVHRNALPGADRVPLGSFSPSA